MAAPPGFVTRELERFSRCGILANGFARVHCGTCGHDRLVAYSRKGRGCCPSCIGRRMADTAARLTDQVFPDVLTRTWTLTLLQPPRYLVACNTQVLSDVLAAYTKAVFNWQRNRAKSVLGLLRIEQAHPGMATWIQRFGSAANLNVHLHSLAFDGVFVEVEPGKVEWRGLPKPQSHDVVTIAWEVCTQVVKALQRRGLSLADESGDIDALAEREPLLAACYAASLRGFVATGRPAGLRVMQMGVPVDAQDGQPSSCGTNGMQAIACIDGPNAVHKILTHIGEPAAPTHFEHAVHHDTFSAA